MKKVEHFSGYLEIIDILKMEGVEVQYLPIIWDVGVSSTFQQQFDAVVPTIRRSIVYGSVIRTISAVRVDTNVQEVSHNLTVPVNAGVVQSCFVSSHYKK